MIPNSVTSIGDSAFLSCNLTSVTIGTSVASIGQQAFAFCDSLPSVTIPKSVTNIGGGAFEACISMNTITVDALNSFYVSQGGVLFNKSQTTLVQYPGGKAGSYTVPNSVTSIGDRAFRYCSSLTSVTIPNSVTSMGTVPFSLCSSMTTITVDASNPVYSSVAGVLFNKSQTTLICYPGGKTGSYTIPNSVTNIGDLAFSRCTSLISVTVPNSVTIIGEQAFQTCTSLIGVYFQGNAPSVGSFVFDGDNNATVYYLPGTTGWTNPWQGRPTVAVVTPYISNVRASQRPGTGLVDVYYNLAGGGSALTVSVAVSTNAGVAYSSPSATVSGALGAGVAPGAKKITWNAGVDLPAKFFSNVRVSVTAAFTGVSPLFAVDTRVGGIAVSGRVLDAASRAPISGAAVSLAGQNTSSSGAGWFSFANVAASGNTLAVSKSGYATYAGTVPARPGATAVTLPDILLQIAPVGNKPVVAAIRPGVNGLFIETVPILNEYTAVVDWRGATPQQVEFFVNGALEQTVPTSSTEATATLVNMGHLFFGSYRLGANRVSAVAVGSAGRSLELSLDVTVIPKPTFLPLLTSLQTFSYNNPKIAFEIVVPPGELKAESDIPIPGMPIKFGFVPSGHARLDYAIATGEWDFEFGGGPRLILGPVGPFEIGLGGHATGRATFDKGIVVETVNGTLYFNLDQKIYEALVSQLVPGGEAFRLLDALKYVGIDPNSIQRINVYANVRLDVDVGVDLPRLRFNPQELQIKVGPKIAFEPDLKIAKVSVYAGGYLGGNFDLDPFALKKITAEMYIGYKVSTWFLPVHSWKGVWFNYEYHFSAARGIDLASALAFDNGWALIPVKRTDANTTMDRNYLSDGPERFVLGVRGASPMAGDSAKASTIPADITALDAFRAVGRMAGKSAAKNATVEKQDGPVHAAGDPEIAQADLPLLENVFPGSQPAMAGRGQDLMLLYVTDNGSPNDLQFTDIRWTRFDGTDWSAPATIHTNTQAEFSPQVAYDGNGGGGLLPG